MTASFSRHKDKLFHFGDKNAASLTGLQRTGHKGPGSGNPVDVVVAPKNRVLPCSDPPRSVGYLLLDPGKVRIEGCPGIIAQGVHRIGGTSGVVELGHSGVDSHELVVVFPQIFDPEAVRIPKEQHV